MRCPNCRDEARLIEWQTFSYYFCDTCKEEVKAASEPKPEGDMSPYADTFLYMTFKFFSDEGEVL